MKTITARCRRCQHVFYAEILDPEEARDPRRPSVPLRCPHCRSGLKKRAIRYVGGDPSL